MELSQLKNLHGAYVTAGVIALVTYILMVLLMYLYRYLIRKITNLGTDSSKSADDDAGKFFSSKCLTFEL